WSSDVCSSDLLPKFLVPNDPRRPPTLACPLLSRGVNAVESPCRETHSDLHEVVVRRLLDRLDVSTVFFPNNGRRLDICEVVLWITGLVCQIGRASCRERV